MPIWVTRPSMPKLEDYIEEIKPVFESHQLTNMGPVYKRFQKQLKEYLEVPELSLFVNGARGKMEAAKKKPGDQNLLAA